MYALPLALGGAAVAGYHAALIAGWVPQWWVPCGAGPSCREQSLDILNGIQLPWLSLLAFVAIALVLLVYHRLRRSPSSSFLTRPARPAVPSIPSSRT